MTTLPSAGPGRHSHELRDVPATGLPVPPISFRGASLRSSADTSPRLGLRSEKGRAW